jgi:hypothetical protein
MTDAGVSFAAKRKPGAHVLRNPRIDDVSSVDRGAGRGVKVVLTKRAESDIIKEWPDVTAVFHADGRLRSVAIEKSPRTGRDRGLG